jgi:hypothetical protein
MTKFEDLNSSAIKTIELTEDNVEIVFNSSDKPYNYTIIDSNFQNLLEKTIKEGESVGKYINSSIKEEKIKQIVQKEEV